MSFNLETALLFEPHVASLFLVPLSLACKEEVFKDHYLNIQFDQRS